MGMLFRFKPNQLVSFWILLSLGMLLIAGCGTTDNPGTTMTTTTPTPQPTCSPHGGDFYLNGDGAIGIQNEQARVFAGNVYGQYSLDPNKLELARSQAIDFLAYETERWSHVEDVRVDETNRVWVVMTFVSPELIRAVLLNHALFNLSQTSTPSLSLDDFSKNILSTLDNQKKYMFMIAIQPETTDESPMSIKIPSSQVVLINNSGLRVNVSANENFLDQTFDFASGRHAGFFFYPFGKVNGGECRQVLDPSTDTIITLSIEAQFGNNKKMITWEIPFAPPLPVPAPIPTPDPVSFVHNDEKTPLKDLTEIDMSQSPDPAFWRLFGRFVWGKMTYDHFSLP
jgi:hypothetical protein